MDTTTDGRKWLADILEFTLALVAYMSAVISENVAAAIVFAAMLCATTIKEPRR